MPTVALAHKTLEVRLSPRAEGALMGLETPLVAEMELYFSCLIRKAVRFRALTEVPDAAAVDERLYVRFRPVVSRACGAKVADGPPPLGDLTLARPDAYVPDWLEIDFRDGQWKGYFGYETD
jgi:hypothetical protein